MRRLAAASVLFALVALSGCSMMREDLRFPEKAVAAKSDDSPVEVGGSGEVYVDNPIQYSDGLILKPVTRLSKPLPQIDVGALSVTESGLQDAMLMALDGQGITLRIDGGPRALERNGPVALIGLHGDLTQVLDDIAAAMGIYWTFDGRTITIEPDRPFVLELPPALGEDTFAGIANTIQWLGGKDVYLDRSFRTLSLRANARAYDRISQYLEEVRATRSMIVYQMRIIQVDLTDSAMQGVDWNAFGASYLARAKSYGPTTTPTAGSDTALSDLGTAFALTRTGTALGAVMTGPHFNVDALLSFLKTQGDVKVLSRPRLAILNGGKGSMRVGQTQTVVSKVGSNVSGGISQVTVETKDLRTGVELSVAGVYSDNTVTSSMKLSISDLNNLTPYTAVGTSFNLATIDDRYLETALRLPPGYSALIGGINIERVNRERDVGAAVNSMQSTVKRSELVIVMQPMVVHFGKPKEVISAASVKEQGK